MSLILWWRSERDSPSFLRIDGGTTAAWHPRVPRPPSPAPQKVSAPATPIANRAAIAEPVTTGTTWVGSSTLPARQSIASISPAPASTQSETAFLAAGAALPSSSALRLLGELRSPDDSRSSQVEFLLYLLPGTNRATGIVKFPGQRPVSVTARWDLNSIDAFSEGDYGFTLHFPTTSSGAFEGFWTSGRKVTGKLTLQIPSPSVSRANPP